MSLSIFIRTRYRKLRAFLLPVSPSVPDHLRSNFRHLIFDIGWYGLLNGSTLAFMTIYAARLGANTTQIGLINAMPAVISLVLALPAGSWLQTRPIDKSIFWSSIGQRLFYLLLVPLPWLFRDSLQIWVVIIFTLLMSIPGALVAVGFNALFAAAVPMRYRGMVAGQRNAVFAIVTVIMSLVCGRILTAMPFPSGYQVVFGIGFFGALMSAVHLWFIRPVADQDQPIEELAAVAPAEEIAPRGWKLVNLFAGIRRRLHFEILKGAFGKSLALLTLFHFVHYLSIPIFPVFNVNILELSDQALSTGNALFFTTMFLGSSQMVKLTNWLGNKKLTGIGIVMLGGYPILLSFAHGPAFFYIASLFGGFAWSLVNVGMVNYLLRKCPLTNAPVTWHGLP